VTFSNWRGVAAPPKLSADQHKAYLALIDKVVKSPSWKGHLEKNGWVDSYLAGDAFRDFIRSEHKRVETLLTALGLIKGAK
jgi:putative tricarboxylic transport membrane protein